MGVETAALPIGEASLRLPEFPTLDDVWTLFMLARTETDASVREARPAHWEAVCHYAEQVRQGLVPERVAPERSVQAVLRSISASLLPGDPKAFVAEALRLCALVDGKTAGGARVLDDDLVGDEPRLQRHVTLLVADVRTYREDVARGRRFFAVIGDRKLSLLVLDRPVSRMFKLWARRDAEAPEGDGYPLLLTSDGKGVVLTADPVRHLSIAFAAAALDASEKKHGGSESWYDGARHEGTLVASPRGGSKLTLDGVVEALRGPLQLTPVKAPKIGRGPVVSITAAAAVGCAVAAAFLLRPTAPTAPTSAPPALSVVVASDAPRPMGSPGANNDLPSEQKVVNLLDPTAGVKTFTHYAIVLGVCSYGSPGEVLPPNLRTDPLRHSCNNAWEFAHLLVRDYRYEPKNVLLMIDDASKVDHPDAKPMPPLGPKPTRQNVLSAIERWKEQHPDAEKQKMTLVFYYSGHGSVVSSVQSKGLPYLQLANWESDLRAKKPVDDTGLPMDRVDQLVKAWIPAKHVLYLFDNCHAGWALRMGESERPDIQKRWADGITYGIAASRRDQSAWEPGAAQGLSVFTRFLIDGLALRDSSAAKADRNDACGSPDHVVTHTELEAYLQKNVPETAKREFNNAIQEPVGQRLDQDGAGQFLFVAPDVEDHLAKRKCP